MVLFRNLTAAVCVGLVSRAAMRSLDDGLGDLSCTRIFTSRRGQRKVKLKFVVPLLGEGGEPGGPLTICWVNEVGRLRHYYVCAPGDVHYECGFTGHSFVVFRGATKPRDEADLLARMICSYRPRRKEKDTVHMITLSSNPTVHLKPVGDDEYRVIIRAPRECQKELPSSDRDWNVTYEYVCPPVPVAPFNPLTNTFYIWGDLDFDEYGGGGKFSMHPYMMNQLVPQIMCGAVLCGNDESFQPHFRSFDTWVMQAQYYWQTELGEKEGSRASCGPLVQVLPGDIISTRISYDAKCGAITLHMKATRHGMECEGILESMLVLEKPFPDAPSMFESWKQFFDEGQKKSQSVGCRATPCLNVEYKGEVSISCLRSLGPWDVCLPSFPGIPEGQLWRVELYSPRQGECQELVGPDQDMLHVRECVKGNFEIINRSAQSRR